MNTNDKTGSLQTVSQRTGVFKNTLSFSSACFLRLVMDLFYKGWVHRVMDMKRSKKLYTRLAAHYVVLRVKRVRWLRRRLSQEPTRERTSGWYTRWTHIRWINLGESLMERT